MTKNTNAHARASVKDYYAEYRTAHLRTVCFWAKGETTEDKELAGAFEDEGDRQNDLHADAHTGIVKTKVRDLEDLYCKLATIKDGFSIVFKNGGEDMKEQRLMLEDAIEWVLAHSLHGNEDLPAATVKIEKKRAA